MALERTIAAASDQIPPADGLVAAGELSGPYHSLSGRAISTSGRCPGTESGSPAPPRHDTPGGGQNTPMADQPGLGGPGVP